MFLGKCKHPIFNVPDHLRDACRWECSACSTNTPAGRARAQSRIVDEDLNAPRTCTDPRCEQPNKTVRDFAQISSFTLRRKPRCNACENRHKRESEERKKLKRLMGVAS
jgi:hypothetical protein